MKFCPRPFYVLFLFIATIIGAIACSTAPVTRNNSNSNLAVAVNSNLANTSVATNTAPSVAANVSSIQNTVAVSPSATVAAYYQSMIKKDEKGFRQVLSKNTLTEFSADAQAEGEKNLVEYWTSFSSPPKQPYEARNERVSGDIALVEVKDSDTGKWSVTKLVRENGEWKLDFTRATVDSLLKQVK